LATEAKAKADSIAKANEEARLAGEAKKKADEEAKAQQLAEEKQRKKQTQS